MLKILLGVGLGFLFFTNQDARQVTAELLRATGDAIDPAEEGGDTGRPNQQSAGRRLRRWQEMSSESKN